MMSPDNHNTHTDDALTPADLQAGPGNAWRTATESGFVRSTHPLFVKDTPPSATPPPCLSSTSPTEPETLPLAAETTTDAPQLLDPAPTSEVTDPDSLLAALTPVSEIRPKQWWRRLFNLGPDTATIRRVRAEQAMRTRFDKPITIVVVNEKGGGGKTPAAIGLAGAIAVARGGGVAVMDANPTGNLVDRLEVEHRLNAGHLLDALDWFEDPKSNVLEVERTLQHQTTGYFKALGCDTRADEGFTREQFERLLTLMRKYFPITVVDTGNDKGGPAWNAAIAAADILVLPFKQRLDHLVPSARTIGRVEAKGFDVRHKLVAVISQEGEPLISDEDLTRHGWFNYPLLRIPADPIIHAGGVIRWEDLNSATRAAYRDLGATAVALATQTETH